MQEPLEKGGSCVFYMGCFARLGGGRRAGCGTGGGVCRPMGFPPTSVPEGFQRASGKPFGAPAGAHSLPGRGMMRRLRRGLGLAVLWVPASFGARRFPKGERKALWCARRRIPLPREGNDAPTTAREQGLQPHGAFTLFFRWRKKSVQKKASGTATPGKSPLLPIFERGSSQCRAQTS